MKILVCINNVPDTTTKIKFVNNTAFDATGVQWIINPWDELALTRAIEIKEGGKAKMGIFHIPNDEFGTLLKKAKKYLPLITINLDKEADKFIIDIPQDTKSLQEAIDKARIASKDAQDISKKVQEAVPQLPCGQSGKGGLTKLIGEYAVGED